MCPKSSVHSQDKSNRPRSKQADVFARTSIRELRLYAESLSSAPNESKRFTLPFFSSKMLQNRTFSEVPSFFVT